MNQTAVYICCVLIWMSSAALGGPPSCAADSGDHFAALQKRLVGDGFHPDGISQIYNRRGVAFEAEGVSLFFVHRESRLNYDQFTSRQSLDRAKDYLRERAKALSDAEAAYGVDKNIITAILLVESRLGKYTGTRSALNTLSTMAALADPGVRKKFWEFMTEKHRISRKRFEKKADRRSGWAYRELKALIKYAAREGIDPTVIKGSYAGAVGLPQFMPSNILVYGGDGDQDGRVDLENHADAVASIAKYLKGHGWQPGLSRQKAEKVIYRYNHSSYYVKTILKIADLLEG